MRKARRRRWLRKRALDELPGDLDPALVATAEAHLIEEAAHHDAKALKHLGRHLLEVAAPDQADAHQATLLEREEREAAAATRLTIWNDGHGRTHGKFTLDTLTGAILKKHLWALASPRHQASKGPLPERRPSPERLGQAFTELIQRYPATKLPKSGGLNATVVVLMPLETLTGGLKAAHLDTGQPLSPALARRLACEAGIIPAVLGTDGQVLELGRKARYYSQAQRIAKTIEQSGRCIAEDCDQPATHMHHPTAWSDDGETNHDGWLICPWHHARAHDTRYRIEKLPNGKVRFHRRT